METALKTIKLIPACGSKQEQFSLQLLQMVMSGEVNPLEMELYLKAMEDVAKKVRSDKGFKEAVIDEAEKYTEKEFRVGNAIVTKSGRSTLDYSDDSEWQRLNNERKDREKMLKGLSKEMVDPDTGEIVKPPTAKYTSFLKIRYDDHNEI